jgi:hypothetical protein
MHGCKYFSIIDISFAFWNIALHLDSQLYTPTWTPIGDYVWQRLRMRLSSSPSTMQMLIEHMLHGIAQAVGFMDDIIVGTDPFDTHLEVLDHIFQQCRVLNFKLRKEKLHLLQRHIRALGHAIGEGGVLEPVFGKIAAIINQPLPSSKEELFSFLGMSEYWRKVLPNYDVVAKPL